jgi:uncharacterized protein YuzE
MRIEFRQHARDRLRQRGITERQVREVLEAPLSATYDPNQVSVRLEGLVANRILRVWVRAPWPPASDAVAGGGRHDSDIDVDFAADAAYLALSDNEVVETREVSPGVLVDLDDLRMVVGVEVLALDAFIPRERLISDYHMRSEDVSILDQVRPSVTTFVQRQTAPVAHTIVDDVLTKA